MPTTKLKLTANELKDVVNPTDSPQLFRYGNDPKLMSEAKAVELIQKEEGDILSGLPEHYRDVVSGNAAGQILTHKKLGARGGETVLHLAFFPVIPDTILLYKNFASNNLPWESRSYEHAMSADDFTLNLTTGGITLTTALTQGDLVYADYRHDAGLMFGSLRNLVLKAARLELYTIFSNWNDATAVIQEMREVIDNKLLAFSAGETPKGVAEIDDVDFYVETRRNRQETMRRPWMRGALG